MNKRSMRRKNSVHLKNFLNSNSDPLLVGFQLETA